MRRRLFGADTTESGGRLTEFADDGDEERDKVQEQDQSTGGAPPAPAYKELPSEEVFRQVFFVDIENLKSIKKTWTAGCPDSLQLDALHVQVLFLVLPSPCL